MKPHHWNPIIPPEFEYLRKERQWILIDTGRDKIAFLHCYLACCTSKNDEFLQWNEDLFCLMTAEVKRIREHGFTVISMGDFNSRIGKIKGLESNRPDKNRNAIMFMDYVSQESPY